MSRKEAHRARVMRELVAGRIGLREAAGVMRVCYRQAKRIRKRFLKKDIEGLIHGNRGRRPANAMESSLRDRIFDLHEENYFDFNDTHFTEKLEECEGIVTSRETVRQILRARGTKAKRRRRPPRHRRRRPPKERKGVMVQWDGSPHHWFGPNNPPCCLLNVVDDADNDLLAGLFVPAESSEGYLRLVAMLLERHGIPLSSYHDRHTTLTRTDDYWSIEEQLQGFQYPTHVGRVLEELGIESIKAGSPQAKGRVERKNGILQDRMIPEMRLKGIQDIQTANEWLKNEYMKHHNARFTKKAAKEGSAFTPISKEQIYHTVSFAYEATVGNDNCVRLGGLIIDIPPGKNGRSFAKKKVLVRQHLDGKWTVWLNKEKIAKHAATEFKEPVRSWKRRNSKPNSRAKEALQVYIASKPAPPQRGHFPF
ncbi:MAG: ISNCY family transposase, partial [Thermodesulfobacteriota bacterium]|nr:ISNCY family transposase [Thermodesulfobacteriota bacterium]